METEPELSVRFDVPAVDDIIDDLIALRSHFGIAYDRMDKDASHLKFVPVVTSELHTRGRAEADRKYVAYDLLECAVRHPRYLSPSDSELMVITLNFAHVRDALGVRRQRAASRLKQLEDKESQEQSETYANIERRAYASTAALMARLSDSPCGRTEADSDNLAKAFAQIAALEDQVRLHQGIFDKFTDALLSLRSAKSDLQKLDACAALLAISPLGHKFARDAWGLMDELQIVARLMIGIVNRYYASWLRFAVFWRGKYGRVSFSSPFTADQLTLFWTTFESGEITSERDILEEVMDSINSEREALGSESFDYEYDRVFDGPERWDGLTELDMAYLLLSRIWYILESSNDWAFLDPGAAARSADVIPHAPLLPVG